MKTHIKLIAALTLLILACFPGCGGGTAGTGGVPLEGRVLEVNGDPIGNAAIFIEPGGFTAITDPNGEFFSIVEPGVEYSVTLEKVNQVLGTVSFVAPPADMSQVVTARFEVQDSESVSVTVTIERESESPPTAAPPPATAIAIPTRIPATSTPLSTPTSAPELTATPIIGTAIPIGTAPGPSPSVIPSPDIEPR